MGNYRTKEQRLKKQAYNNARLKVRRRDPATWSRWRWNYLSKMCAKYGRPFNLEPSDLKIPKVCPVFKTPFVMGGGQYHPQGPSVDKTIPSLGYVKGNVQVISWRANRLKYDVTDPNELREVANYLANKLRSRI